MFQSLTAIPLKYHFLKVTSLPTYHPQSDVGIHVRTFSPNFIFLQMSLLQMIHEITV